MHVPHSGSISPDMHYCKHSNIGDTYITFCDFREIGSGGSKMTLAFVVWMATTRMFVHTTLVLAVFNLAINFGAQSLNLMYRQYFCMRLYSMAQTVP